MATSIIPGVHGTIIIENGDSSQTYKIHEGDVINDLVYTVNGVRKTISGAVRVINAAARSVTINQTCPPEPYFDRIVSIGSIIIDSSAVYDAELQQVNIADIVSIGSVVDAETANDPDADATVIGPGSEYKTIQETINAATGDTPAKVKLSAGEYAQALTLTKSATIIGPLEGAQKPAAKTRATTVSTEAILNGAVVMNSADAEIEFRGVSFTGASLFTITAAKSVKFINCRFEGITATIAKTMMMKMDTNAQCVLVIDGCYFGTPDPESTGKMYHITEPNGTLLNGSYFANNYFDLDCTTHNKLNFYKAEDGIEITVENNYDAKSASMMRLGFQGAITATVNIKNNTYDDTDVEQWAGLCGMQPYNKATTDMSKWTVNFEGNINNSQFPQITYMYFNATDMPFDETKLPKVFVDGEAYELPIINEQA